MRQANIYLRDAKAGVLTEDENGYTFRYDESYLRGEGAEAISLTLPLTDRPYRDKVLFPFFDGLIPEGWLLDVVEANWKIDGRDRMSLLLACCRDCIGAVSVVPADNDTDNSHGEAAEAEIGEDEGVGRGVVWNAVALERGRGGAGRCLYCYGLLNEGERDFHRSCARKMFRRSEAPLFPYVRDDVKRLAGEVVQSRITVPGVQAKLSMELSGGRRQPDRFTIVGLWGKYILKPQTDRFESLPEIEDVTMHLARIAGIEVAPHSLIRFADGELCYLTKRVDREDSGKKIAMEDMCQLTERLTELKYKGSYEQIAKAVLRYTESPQLNVEMYWERVLFSWLTGNTDMHLKNFSLLGARGQYKLSPAYDLLSTLLVMNDEEEMALTLNAKKRRIRKEDFVTAMRRSGMEDKVIGRIFGAFLQAEARWMAFIDISFVPEKLKAGYKRLIADRLACIR